VTARAPDRCGRKSRTGRPRGQCCVARRAIDTGGTAPICTFDPGAVPKAVDVITPPGVSQATELDPPGAVELIADLGRHPRNQWEHVHARHRSYYAHA